MIDYCILLHKNSIYEKCVLNFLIKNKLKKYKPILMCLLYYILMDKSVLTQSPSTFYLDSFSVLCIYFFIVTLP